MKFPKRTLVTVGLVIGGLAAWNQLSRRGVGPIETSLGGTEHFYPWRDGHVFYEEAGAHDAPPLLLLHGFNAAASSYEMRNVFAGLRDTYHVYAPDLLGYGRSDRPAMKYTADLYVDLISDFVRDVIQAPAHVIASSLACAHLVGAVTRHPERYQCLVLICPTGLDSLANPAGVGAQVWHRFLATPVIGTGVFTAVASRPSLRYFLRNFTYKDPQAVTESMIDDYYVESHQPDARWAPISFLSAQLNRDIRAEWPVLANPVLIVWGRSGRFSPIGELRSFLLLRPQTAFHVFEEAGVLPHDEQADAFNAYVKHWLANRDG